jgi:hypothetical protein
MCGSNRADPQKSDNETFETFLLTSYPPPLRLEPVVKKHAHSATVKPHGRRVKGIARDAARLGCSQSRLSLAVRGKLHDPDLLARYIALRSEPTTP